MHGSRQKLCVVPGKLVTCSRCQVILKSQWITLGKFICLRLIDFNWSLIHLILIKFGGTLHITIKILSLFVQKGHISVYGPVFIFCRRDQGKLIFGTLTCFDMRNIVPELFLLICSSFLHFVFLVCKETGFSKWHLLHESLQLL